MTQLIIPIVSNSDYFSKEDYFFPKPLIDIDGLPMILKVTQNFEKYMDFDKYIFIMPEFLSNKYSVDSIIKLNTDKKTEFVFKKGETSGALCSSLLSIDKISDNEEIVVANMDEIIEFDLNKIISFYRENFANAGMITFKSNHPRWVYLNLDDKGKVSFCAEKKVISNYAGAGFYYFKDKKTFYDASINALFTGNAVGNNFYLSYAINNIILEKGNVFAFKLNEKNYHTFYKPQSINSYLKSKKEVRSISRESEKNVNIVIPAAGKGSRFKKKGWKSSKPLIDINGKAMINRVLKNLALDNCKFIVVTQNNIKKNVEKSIKFYSEKNIEIIGINSFTEGTACTVLKSYNLINNKNPLLIANSDQLVDFDCNEIVKKCNEENLDGIILTFKDPEKDPKWSFVLYNEKGLVIKVAEKKPISDTATVGIYYFKKGSDFVEGAIEMIINSDKVNDEYYVCPVYNYLIKKGLKIGILDIKRDQMHGLGTPDDLIKYLESHSLPKSVDSPN